MINALNTLKTIFYKTEEHDGQIEKKTIPKLQDILFRFFEKMQLDDLRCIRIPPAPIFYRQLPNGMTICSAKSSEKKIPRLN